MPPIFRLTNCGSKEGRSSGDTRGEKAQKQTRTDSRAGYRRSRNRSEREIAAQKAPNTIQEPVVTEPVEQAKTVKGRVVRRPARFRT
jgi:hypothetical protein